MEKSVRKKKIIITSIIMFIVLFAFACIIYKSNEPNKKYHMIMKDGWSFSRNGETTENVDLSEFAFPKANRGDEFEYKRIIPENDIQNPILVLWYYHSAVKVYLDDEIILDDGFDRYEDKQIEASGYTFVNLPDDYEGKEIRVIMKCAENNSFSSCRPPEIADAQSWMKDFIMANRGSLAIVSFLLVLVVILLFTSVFFSVLGYDMYKGYCICGFCLGVSMWSICYYDLIVLFTYNRLFKSLCEYYSIFTWPLFLFLLFRKSYFQKKSKMQKINTVAIFANLLLLIVSSVCQLLNIVHAMHFLIVCHILIAVLIIESVLNIVYDIVKKEVSDPASYAGIIIMCIAGGFELARYNLFKYFKSSSANLSSMLCFYCLLLVISQIISMCVDIIGSVYETTKSKMLKKLAYEDPLTGTANRRRFEDQLELFGTLKSDFAIISLDINDLKKVNDGLGHEKGDELISAIATCMKKAFSEYGLVSRTGGDEFIVSIEKLKNIDLKKITENFEKIMEEEQKKHPDMKLSCSYGYCTSEEIKGHDSKEVLRIADERMYTMKKKIKEENKQKSK